MRLAMITSGSLLVSEVLHLDPTFFDQGLQAVVDAAQAGAEFFGQSSLLEVGGLEDTLRGPETGPS